VLVAQEPFAQELQQILHSHSRNHTRSAQFLQTLAILIRITTPVAPLFYVDVFTV